MKSAPHLLAVILCGFLAACASAPQAGPGVLATTRIPAPPLQISQAAVDVMARYSYSVSAAQFPVSLNFEKTGNSADTFAYTDPATLVLSIQPDGPESIVTFRSLVGRFNVDQLKRALDKIKAEAVQ